MMAMALATPLPEAEEEHQFFGRQPVDNSSLVEDPEAIAVITVTPTITRPPICVCFRSPCPCDRLPWGK